MRGFEHSATHANLKTLDEDEKPSTTIKKIDVIEIDLTESDEDTDEYEDPTVNHNSSSPSILSSSPPDATTVNKMSSSSNRCVGRSNSPPLISLETPPSVTSQSPHSFSLGGYGGYGSRNPYPSPTPSHLSSASQFSPHHSGFSPHLTPPPAHSNSTHSTPSSYMPHLDPITDSDFDDFLNMMSGLTRGYAAYPFYPSYYPFMSQFAAAAAAASAASTQSSSSSSNPMPENLSLRPKNYAMK